MTERFDAENRLFDDIFRSVRSYHNPPVFAAGRVIFSGVAPNELHRMLTSELDASGLRPATSFRGRFSAMVIRLNAVHSDASRSDRI
jgi:hypothetical protein